MIPTLNIISIIALGYVAYQDLKYRAVYWFLFPILACLLGTLQYQNVALTSFVNTTMINLSLVIFIVGFLYIYAAWRIKRPFFTEVFGLGDLFFFAVLAIAFPTMAFIIIFVCSILFSILLWVVLQKHAVEDSVPLAGYMAVFLGFVLGIHWVFPSINLYLI